MSDLEYQQESNCLSAGGGDNTALDKMLLTSNKLLSTPNARRTPKTTPKTSTSSVDILRSTPNARQRLQKCRRAISLEDLTPEKKKHRVCEEARQRKRCPTQAPHSKQAKDLTSKAKTEKLAAQRIYQIFTLNVWQNQRKRAEKLKLEITQSTAQVNDFHKQTAVLMQMLNAEKHRMTQAGLELQAKMEQMEESNTNLHLASKEKLEREQQLVTLEIQLTKMQTKLETDVDDFKDLEEHYNVLGQHLEQIKRDIEKCDADNKKLDEMGVEKQRTISKLDEAIQTLEIRMARLTEQELKESQSLELANAKQTYNQETLLATRVKQAEATNAVEKAMLYRTELLARTKALKKELEVRDVERNNLEQSISYKELEIGGLRDYADHQHRQIQDMSWRKRVRSVAKAAVPVINYILTQRIS